MADTIGDRVAPAVAGGRPAHPGAKKPVPQLGSPSAVPSNPNRRLGGQKRHLASPVAQGRVKMDAIVVGIDVAKDKLYVAIRPSGEAFGVSRDAQGLDAGIALLAPLSPWPSRSKPPVASRPWWRRASRRQDFPWPWGTRPRLAAGGLACGRLCSWALSSRRVTIRRCGLKQKLIDAGKPKLGCRPSPASC